MAVSPAEAVLIGDTVDDSVAAQIAGIGCILFDTGNGLHAGAALRQTGLTVVPSLADALVEVRRQRCGSG
jgi:phosphoglycolate phosphatase-like HAD superfamily hydrolase